jgi:PKD repeat protein
LTKKDLTKKIVAGGLIISLLLAVWMFIPTFIDYLFGGSRGNYNTHEPLPTDHETYDLYEIPYVPGLVFDPTLFDPAMFTPELLEMLRDLLDPQNMDIPNDFSGFNLSNFDLPLFYINDVGVVGDYTESMRQNVYDVISADGTAWSRASSTLAPVDPGRNVVWGPQSSFREVTFVLNVTETINLRLPMFSYTPKYVDGSMRYISDSGTFNIPDDDVLSNDTYESVEVSAYGLPSYSGATNYTYGIVHDDQMTTTRVTNYKSGAYLSNVPTSLTYAPYANYLQIPGVDSLRDLTPYLNTHPRFAAALSSLSSTFNKATSRTHTILNGIVAYLYANYDVFTTFPERPGSGQDMVEWFLSRPQTSYPNAGGTPYDFAVAFTMLARAFDVPARVVTGYYDWDGDGVVTLSNVYAWAEALIPQLSAVADPWINYDFVPQFNSSEMLPFASDMIWIDTPAMSQTFLNQTGLPLNLRMFTNSTITDITYSIDGGANQSVLGVQVPMPGYPGAYTLNTTFNVASPGVHTIQAFLHTTNGTVGSNANTFIVNMDTGYFVSVSSPVNNSVTMATTIVLNYTAVNSSTVTSAFVDVYYLNNGTAALSNFNIAPLPVQVTSFPMTRFGTFVLVVTLLTELGGFTSLTTLGPVIFTRPPADLFPDAWFYPSSSNVLQGQNVAFIHAGSNGDTPATYQWNFGDGPANATLENPIHAYASPGSYNVTLSIWDADGDFDTVTRLFVVTVSPNSVPDPMVVVNATNIYPGQSIQFTHVGTPGDSPYSRSWTFGDTTTAGNLTTVVHQYNIVGNYTAVFSITDGNGDTRTCIIPIVVSLNATTLTVDFAPRSVEVFQNITIWGNLRFTNGTGIGSQTISLSINFWASSTLLGTFSTTAVTAAGTGFYSVSVQVLYSSEFILIEADFAGTPFYSSATATIVG